MDRRRFLRLLGLAALAPRFAWGKTEEEIQEELRLSGKSEAIEFEDLIKQYNEEGRRDFTNLYIYGKGKAAELRGINLTDSKFDRDVNLDYIVLSGSTLVRTVFP